MKTLERSAEGLDLRILDVSELDLLRAAPDAIATNAGYGPAAPHPLAEDLFEINLATMAAHYGNLVSTTSARHGFKAVAAGMKSLEFTEIVENVGKRVITKTFERDDTINRIARPLPKENFKASYLASVELLTQLESQVENAELPMLMGRVTDQKTPELRSWGLAIFVQRRDVINNDQLLLGQLFEEAGQLAHRHQIKTVIDYIESNPTLPELDSKGGEPRDWFTVSDGNLVTGTLSGNGLRTANKAMRNQTAASGDKENIAPKIILCPTAAEYELRKVVKDGDLPLEVVPSCHIGDDHYYVLADPAQQPALGVQFLGRPTDRRIKTWALRTVPKMPAHYDGIGYVLNVDMSPVAMSRKGIVRVDL
jgi:hypothetical protein